ncbi:MAG TPA: aldolase/citrate lyase family protein [Limnobacter sp.]|nr:aldolase/citrate lyase family protein [Limnobacter sp.]
MFSINHLPNATDFNPSLGLLNAIPNTAVVDLIARCGFDFIVLDTEHTLTDASELRQALMVLQGGSCLPLVRTPGIDRHWLAQVMDAGAQGIVLSRAESSEQIQALAQAMYFPPNGQRGMTGGIVTGYGELPLAHYMQRVAEHAVLVPMIESKTGLDELPSMLETGLVSFVMEGALDLSLDLGVGPDPFHPRVWEALLYMDATCSRYKVPFCPNPRNQTQWEFWRSSGKTIYLCGEDRSHFCRALRAQLNAKTASTSSKG